MSRGHEALQPNEQAWLDLRAAGQHVRLGMFTTMSLEGLHTVITGWLILPNSLAA